MIGIRRNQRPTKLICIDIPQLKESAKKTSTCGLRARHKLAILTRDGFKCAVCGKAEKLTIAHIKPLAERPGSQGRNASSYKVDECKTICVACHILEEFGREYV